MKRILLAFLLTPMLLKAQQCDFIQNNNDPFTGKATKITSTYLSGSALLGAGETVLISKVDNIYNFTYMFMGIMDGSSNIDYINGVDYNKVVLFIKFEDDEVLKLKSIEEYAKENNIALTPNRTIITGASYLNKEQLEKIASKQISLIRLAIDGDINKPYDVEVKKNKRAKIMQSAKCILLN
jgi:hypothetical protein